jgi:uncharacterized protein (TIGR00297 family)
VTQSTLAWQSKLVLLAVVPMTAIDLLFKTQLWVDQQPTIAIWTLGVSLVLGLITWHLRAATPAGAATGALITASLMLSTLVFPYEPWRTALVPIVLVSLLAFVSTRAGRTKKMRLGTAEEHRGRSAAQVAANLGAAALVVTEFFRTSMTEDSRWQWLARLRPELAPLSVAVLAALAEAAADTVSSELGQVFGGRPRMLTTLQQVEPGTDGAITYIGSLAGATAAVLVALAGTWAFRGSSVMFAISASGAIFGLFFDSLLGATLERHKLINNDAVNFLSTVSVAAFALIALSFSK